LKEIGIARETICVKEASTKNGRPGSLDIELLSSAGQRLSGCRIIPLTIRIGISLVKVDGIGDVETAESHRGRGFGRRVMEAAVAQMEHGESALSMLYGITDYYPKFGFVTSGPEATLSLPLLNEPVALPAGWNVRGFESDDLPALQVLYERATLNAVGTAVRPNGGYPWGALLDSVQGGTSNDCRVIVSPDGAAVGYVWRGEELTFVRLHSGYQPDALILAEAVAEEGTAADLAIQVCRSWGAEVAASQSRTVSEVMLFMPAEGAVADAARHVPSTFRQGYGPDGGWMARVLNAERLFRALQPELSFRLTQAGLSVKGSIRMVTDAGSVTLDCEGGLRLVSGGGTRTVNLPQTTLVRLALGAYRPQDLLRRLDSPMGEEMENLLATLFPKREPQLYLADRF
jgi:GNAT superfamily N-acetyltransferase